MITLQLFPLSSYKIGTDSFLEYGVGNEFSSTLVFKIFQILRNNVCNINFLYFLFHGVDKFSF